MQAIQFDTKHKADFLNINCHLAVRAIGRNYFLVGLSMIQNSAGLAYNAKEFYWSDRNRGPG